MNPPMGKHTESKPNSASEGLVEGTAGAAARRYRHQRLFKGNPANTGAENLESGVAFMVPRSCKL